VTNTKRTIKSLIWLGLLIMFSTLYGRLIANAQPINWDIKNAQNMDTPLQSLSAKDQQGIVRRLGGKPVDFSAMSVHTSSGNFFLVQVVGDACGADGNCESWILSSEYRVILHDIAEAFYLQPTAHEGLPDIVTYGHASAVEGNLTYWRMHGGRYIRISCAGKSYIDADGNTLKNPRITPSRCGTGR
jgi:hypothetical protein